GGGGFEAPSGSCSLVFAAGLFVAIGEHLQDALGGVELGGFFEGQDDLGGVVELGVRFAEAHVALGGGLEHDGFLEGGNGFDVVSVVEEGQGEVLQGGA